ncbi:hypothetical protein DEX24_12320 [Kurthia sibirica]|uniref:DUF1700 domain-containing protein n=2 Tax=Kurthia sibirica TaxID=202750 RepID=A0A2U3AJL6_9BACL|nr:hypothetical protein DEX24_12320 [Kurthia sibirica]
MSTTDYTGMDERAVERKKAMNKIEFTEELHGRLSEFNQQQRAKIINNYATIIDDQIGDGRSEERSVSTLGHLDDLAKIAVLDLTPVWQLVLPRKKDLSLHRTKIMLLSPLILLFLFILLTIHSVIWCGILFAFTVNNILIIGGIVSMALAFFLFDASIIQGIIVFFCGLVSATLSIFFFSPTKKLSRIILRLKKECTRSIKSYFI